MFVMISGFSSGGKSTLLEELSERGYQVVREPGRRILEEERKAAGAALPWVDRSAFGRRAIEMSIDDFRNADGLTFFDRGIVDASVAMVAGGDLRPDEAISEFRYDLVFLAPPWPEIFVNDEDRRHTLDQSLMDFDRIAAAYSEAGYRPVMLPKDTVKARAKFVLDHVREAYTA